MSSRHLNIIPLVLALAGAGCGGNLGPYTVEPRRVRIIEPLQLPPLPDAPAEPIVAERPSPAETRGLSIGDVRQLVLETSPDLRVIRFDEPLAQLRLNEERAAFEALFVADGRYADLHRPTATQLQGSRVEQLTLAPGVVIPLRTGGDVRLDAPLSRLETNNPFATLDPSYEASARATINQPLLRGFGRDANEVRIRVTAAQLGQIQARTKLEVTRLLAEAERTYWRFYAAGRAVDVREGELELATQQLDRARRLRDAGTVAEIDVLRAESGVADAREQVLVARNALRDWQRQLKRILDAPDLEMNGPTQLLPETSPQIVRYQLDADALAEYALRSRMELVEAELRLAEEAAILLSARRGTLPVASLQYQYAINGLGGSFGDALSQVGDADFADHAVGLQVQVPLGNAAARSRLRQAMLRRTRELADQGRVRLRIRQEVYAAADALETAWERIAAATERVRLASRVLDAETRQFELGLRTATEINEARTRLAAAKLDEIRALVDYEVARIDLAFATGTVAGGSNVELAPAEPPR